MTDWGKLSDEIFESYFKQTEMYVSRVLASGDNHMDCLLAYYQEAWKVPKRFKGNSAAMGFVPEFLIFEIVKQCLEKKYKFKFDKKDRSQTSGGLPETAYFVDGPEARHLLVQGLRIRTNKLGFPPTDCQHDVTYMVKDENWMAKAIIEVKGYYESASLKGDIEKLENAEKKYPKTDDCAFAFVGFIRSSEVSSPSIKNIRPFVAGKNHYFVSPGDINPKIGNSSLEDLLDRL